MINIVQNGHLVTLVTMPDGIAVGATSQRGSDRNWSQLRDMINQGEVDDDMINMIDCYFFTTGGEIILRNLTWTILPH